MSARFRQEDRNRLAPELAKFIEAQQPQMQQALLMTFLTAGDAYLSGMLRATVNEMPAEERSELIATIGVEAESLARKLKAQLDPAMPQVAIGALMYLLNEQIGAIETNPWEHPWVLEALKKGQFGLPS